jgi:hypothetical protein
VATIRRPACRAKREAIARRPALAARTLGIGIPDYGISTSIFRIGLDRVSHGLRTRP